MLCSLTGMDKHPHAHNPSGRTPPALERDGQSGGCPCFAGKTRVRAGDKATVTGRISDMSIALSGGYSQSKFYFWINRNQSPGPGGKKASRARDRISGPVARAFRVGQPLPRKIMPDVDIVPTRQGSLVGIMVSLSGPTFTRNEK